jgi:hypothetical protein
MIIENTGVTLDSEQKHKEDRENNTEKVTGNTNTLMINKELVYRLPQTAKVLKQNDFNTE